MEKLSGAADLHAAVAITKDAGFDEIQDDLNNYQASQGSISAEELAAISSGKNSLKYSLKVNFVEIWKPGSHHVEFLKAETL